MKLRSKIRLYTSVLFIALLIIMNASIYFVFSHLMKENELERAQAEVEKVSIIIGRAADRIAPSDLLRANVPVDGMIQLLKKDLTSDGKITSPSEVKLGARTSSFYQGEVRELLTYKGTPYVFISVPIVWRDGSVVNLQVTNSIESTDEMINILAIVLIVITVIIMVPTLISSRILSNLIIQPIRTMINTMKDIQKSGQFKQLKLEDTTEGELVEMGETFNHMMSLLQTNYEKQEQFVSNASHELRTPLTIIENYADLLKRRGLERPDLFEESIDAIHSEAIRMREMTEQLLSIARQDQWNIQMEQINITQLVEETANTFQTTYQRDMNIQGNKQIMGYTDIQKLKQLLFIFLDNALKYSDGPITIHVGQTEKETAIQIEDSGIGISKEDLPKVFDRFYRVDQARSRKKGGSGLGLTMAKDIADALGARIELSSKENEGTIVTLYLQKEK
ncbi:HAMP domain-containing protein [Psychrobacillus sp. OK028]|uniref:sensor histidine kinase n=1 Tax=Psychrobacillus sp. OK028 TaxID=1884359 RepID=UPI0008828172|nr:HAMP domain-containing sensor histidine kinase [Psychrobacillus sp. OK028]SDN58200.1 HAMP domain-containing protein [Psychrobacillus sp. OK028]